MVVWSEDVAESSSVQVHDEQTATQLPVAQKAKQASVVEIEDDVENASVKLEERDYKRKQARSVAAPFT